MTDAALRCRLVQWGGLLFARGLTGGSSGNLSVRTDNGFLVTPTNSCLGLLDPDRLSGLDADWVHRSGDKPTKELALHRAFYEGWPEVPSRGAPPLHLCDGCLVPDGYGPGRRYSAHHSLYRDGGLARFPCCLTRRQAQPM